VAEPRALREQLHAIADMLTMDGCEVHDQAVGDGGTTGALAYSRPGDDRTWIVSVREAGQ